MECKVCTTTPEIPNGYNRLIITASHEYMLQKILYRLGSIFEINNFQNYLEVITRELEFFVSTITKDSSFTEIEFENIKVLPLK